MHPTSKDNVTIIGENRCEFYFLQEKEIVIEKYVSGD
jgi:hypothetical protein